ncbi:hypothetical protein yc1106_02456 [Curvularia clavata]|uniref:Uncharacterized protein n=1 Tax=Curvularia clavata TaxID=95742 RepID=A0A9Q8Z3S5_CURCL|nr:hypothetical protein yc1106_02456 [Curvularia clavata]
MWALISFFCNVCLEVADTCSEVIDFLLWEADDDIRFDLQVDLSTILFSLFVWVSLLLVVLFALGIHFNFDIEAFKKWLFGDEYHHHIEDATEQGQSVELTTPSPPPPPYSGPATPLMYPPVEFPFEHFRATGESFAPSRRYFHEERPRYSPPILYEPLSSCSAEVKPSESADSAPLQEHHFVPEPRIEKDSGEFQVPTPITRDAMKMSAQPQPSSPPAPHTNIIMGSPPSHVSIPSPSPTPLSPESILRNALDLVAQEEHKIQEQMDIFLSTITTGAGYEVAAALILNFMQEAIQYLEPLFPAGLGLIPLEHRPWTRSIVMFWKALSPYGWDFLHHPDGRVPEFFRRFRCAATWFGLDELLVEFRYEAPPLPEPVPTPTVVEPQLQEQPSVSSMLTPVPTSFSLEKGNRASRLPSRTSRTSKTPTKPKLAQPEQSNPNLLKFDDPELHNLPTEKLKELTWSSFAWSSPSQAAIKIWSYSTVGRLVLPEKKDCDLSPNYVKSCLEDVAADFKRASIVLRLQARDCKRPCEDDVPMAPLFGEVLRLIKQAVDFTERCDNLAVWDTQDQWFNACLYFRDAVRLDKDIWETLCAWYGPEKYRPLRKAWKQGSTDWLLLDEQM